MCQTTKNKISNNFIDEYLSSVEFDNVLSENDSNFFEQFPTCEECIKAVMNLKSTCNKFSGLDGLTYEYYHCFWKDLNQLFQETLKYIFEKDQMS